MTFLPIKDRHALRDVCQEWRTTEKATPVHVNVLIELKANQKTTNTDETLFFNDPKLTSNIIELGVNYRGHRNKDPRTRIMMSVRKHLSDYKTVFFHFIVSRSDVSARATKGMKFGFACYFALITGAKIDCFANELSSLPRGLQVNQVVFPPDVVIDMTKCMCYIRKKYNPSQVTFHLDFLPTTTFHRNERITKLKQVITWSTQTRVNLGLVIDFLGQGTDKIHVKEAARLFCKIRHLEVLKIIDKSAVGFLKCVVLYGDEDDLKHMKIDEIVISRFISEVSDDLRYLVLFCWKVKSVARVRFTVNEQFISHSAQSEWRRVIKIAKNQTTYPMPCDVEIDTPIEFEQLRIPSDVREALEKNKSFDCRMKQEFGFFYFNFTIEKLENAKSPVGLKIFEEKMKELEETGKIKLTSNIRGKYLVWQEKLVRATHNLNKKVGTPRSN